MAIIGKRLNNITPSVTKIAMNLGEYLRMVQSHFWHEFARGYITAALGLE